MNTFDTILQTVQSYHELGETIPAAEYVLDTYNLRHPNFGGFELREKADPKFILMTTEGEMGQPQIIRIPENTFAFEFTMMLNLLAHEMIHVMQKSPEFLIIDKNEREWQAYTEMLFHTVFPQIPNASVSQRLLYAKKAIEYYNRMESGGALQLKYAEEKNKVETLIESLSAT